jgi:hypothetical protein
MSSMMISRRSAHKLVTDLADELNLTRDVLLNNLKSGFKLALLTGEVLESLSEREYVVYSSVSECQDTHEAVSNDLDYAVVRREIEQLSRETRIPCRSLWQRLKVGYSIQLLDGTRIREVSVGRFEICD